jgi:ribosomal protein S18 acetylase RimI-like enzyme
LPLPPETTISFVVHGAELRLSNLGQLELLRAVNERGVPLRTTARGFSMHPFIRDRDVLTIAPLHDRGPRVGDVAAFILPDTGRLAIHRIVGKNVRGWLLKGDNCEQADGVVVRENLIGRVTRIERKGRDVRFGLGPEGRWIALLNRGQALMRLKGFLRLLRRVASTGLRDLQGTRLYGAMGRRLLKQVVIVEATERDLEAVHRRFNPSEAYQKQSPDPHVTNWVARQGEKIIGFAQLVHHPEAHFPWVGWWLFSLHVWPFFRGLGIGKDITRHAIGHAENVGVQELHLAVFEDNRRAIRLYRKLGFARTVLPGLEPIFAAEKQQHGRRRIVMRKVLGGALGSLGSF